LLLCFGGENVSRFEDRKTLLHFLPIFLPLGFIFFTDELLRTTRWLDLPWLPLLPLFPRALYCFVASELLVRMQQIRTERTFSASEESVEKLVLTILEACEASPLTPRERKVLVEIFKGQSNAAIAEDLDISPNVKNYVYSIFQKTGAGSRKELYLFAVRRGKPTLHCRIPESAQDGRRERAVLEGTRHVHV
jgi:DNA-binding CsgD family transcriptional regulator